MAKRENLIRSNTLYTIKKKHSSTKDSNIFENDYVTIVPNDGLYDDGMALFSDSNFKYKIRTGNEGQKRHSRGKWVKDSKDSEEWTKSSLSTSAISKETKIVAKPNYSSLKDFAYYGSAIELIRYTVNDIISKVPSNKSGLPDFYDSLDDFERVLLNTGTTPLYKATFETPYFNEKGYFFSEKNYIWPSTSEGIPLVSGGTFQGYVSSLISLAEYHDEIDSDNIWRMLTHEAIKNLDWTFIGDKDGGLENIDIDNTRIKAMLRIWGRQFDELKRHSDNIKNSSSISYNEKSNMPDYFLSDNLEMKGWDAQSVAPLTNDKVTITKGDVTTYLNKSASDVNVEFMRRLALSSDYIQSMKGTRRGIETILGLFGYKKANEGTTKAFTYDIEENIYVAQDFPNYCEISNLRTLGEYAYYDDNENLMDGYPVLKVEMLKDNGTEDKEQSYIIPWFNKFETYKYPFYFQEKGGWGNIPSKTVQLDEDITTATTITGGGIYRETSPYITYVETIEDMLSIPNDKVFENMVCYVTDITPLSKEGGYTPDNGDEPQNGVESYSHYFILKSVSLSTRLGYVYVKDLYDCYGWKNVYKETLKSATEKDAIRVIYLESICPNYKGNNPHGGKGNYDNGGSYISKFNNIFGDAIDDGIYDFLAEEDKDSLDEIRNAGFNATQQTDNKKCYYFDDTSNGALIGKIMGTNTNEANLSDTGYNFFNPEGGAKYDEAAANSVINVKTLTINFGIGGNQKHKKYIEDVILKYLEPMIPSTSILSYKFDGNGGSTTLETLSYSVNNGNTNLLYDVVYTLSDDLYYISGDTGVQVVKQGELNKD